MPRRVKTTYYEAGGGWGKIPSSFFLRRLKMEIREMVPTDFEWVFELPSDLGCLVRWRWTGVPGVKLWGSVADADYSIMREILRHRDWVSERKRAMAVIDEQEAYRLRALQAKRLAELEADGKLDGRDISLEDLRPQLGPRRKPKIGLGEGGEQPTSDASDTSDA